MNLADYLSELLGQYEEVSVPGLGYFVRERVNGYYNDHEARFYPPYHKVKFVPQPKDDDTFAQYVADKKNISLASSKYFAEKFVSKLKEQALTSKYLFADLGLFYTDQNQLLFKANDKIADDPAFYGYPPVNIYKQAQPTEQAAKPVYTEPVATTVSSLKPVQTTAEDDHFYEGEETGKKKRTNVWLIVLIAVIAVAIVLFGVFKFYPQAFDKLGSTFSRVSGKADTVVPVYRHEVKPVDTVKKEIPAKDTSAKIAPVVVAAADSTAQLHFEIIENNFRKEAAADQEVKKLKAKDIPDAKVLTKQEAPGPHFKVSAGTYATEAEAAAKKDILVKAGKIRKDSYILPIKL